MMQISASPQSIIGLLRNSLALYKKSWLKLLPITILIVGVLTILIMLFPKQTNVLLVMKHHMSVKSLITIIGFYCVMFWLFLVLFYKCYRILIAADIKYDLVFLIASLKFFPCMAVLFLYAMIVTFGMICFVVPGIFLVFLLSYSFLAVLIDNKNIFSSFKYSAQLVWGNWWRTFTIFLITFLLMMIFIVIIIAGVNFIVMSLLHLKVMMAITVLNIIAMILSLFIWIFLANVFVCQYYDLKLRYQSKASG